MTPQANKKLYDDLFILNSKGWKIFGDKEDASSLSFLIDKEGFLPIGESVIKFQCTCNLDHIRNCCFCFPKRKEMNCWKTKLQKFAAIIVVKIQYTKINFS